MGTNEKNKRNYEGQDSSSIAKNGSEDDIEHETQPENQASNSEQGIEDKDSIYPSYEIEIQSIPLDVSIIDEKSGELIHNPWMNIVIHSLTRSILGMYISTGALHNAQDIIKKFRHEKSHGINTE